MSLREKPTLDDLERLAQLVESNAPLGELLPHQQPPDDIDEGWLIQAGRGAGKTAAMAKYVTDHVNGRPCIKGDMPHKMALIGPTIGDAVESAERHPVCLKTLNPTGRLQTKAGGTIFTFPNGSEIKLFGTNNRRDVDHLRAGGNNCLVWVEELAAWPELDEGWDQMQLGLRIGPHPHWVGSSTPKNRPKFRRIVADPHHTIVQAHTDDNPHLESSYRERLERLFGGTTKGRQELGGELLDEADAAHWRRAWIDEGRLDETLDAARVVVGVDPQGAESGMTGIVVAAITSGYCACGSRERLPHAYVLEDASINASPNGWAKRAVKAFDDWSGDRIVAERNFGADMVEATIRTAWEGAPLKTVVASRGKVVRAEPVASLYEQGRVHHIGSFPDLEDEMTTYTDEESWSPNRLDALVWAMTELNLWGKQSQRLGGVDLTAGLTR